MYARIERRMKILCSSVRKGANTAPRSKVMYEAIAL